MSTKIRNKKSKTSLFLLFLLWSLSKAFLIDAAELPNRLESIAYRPFDEMQSQIILKFSRNPQPPQHFSIDLPPSQVFDFPNVTLNLPEKDQDLSPHAEFIDAISLIEDNNRTRMMVDVTHIAPVEIQIFGQTMTISFKHQCSVQEKIKLKPAKSHASTAYIQAVEFAQEYGAIGKIVFEGELKHAKMDIKEEDRKIILTLPHTEIADSLIKTFDVHHLGTNIKKFTVKKEPKQIFLHIETEGEYVAASYHLGEKLIFETRPKQHRLESQKKSQSVQLTSDHVSFNFQDIELRAVLHVLAEMSDKNLIVGDGVQGRITLRLDDVSWDKAFDVILKLNKLSQKKMGDVLMILPTEEFIASEEAAHVAQSKLETFAPLHAQKVDVKYANAASLAAKISGDPQLLSSRGSVHFDERTNQLFIKDTQKKLSNILSLVEAIDVPVRQVMIESQIVETDQSLSEMLGLKFSAHSIDVSREKSQHGFFYDNVTAPLHMTGKPGTLKLAVANLPVGTLLDLELQALEQESKGKVLARPKLLTLDKKSATIENGTEIPFATLSEKGTHTQFKKAVLSLAATPHITPDEKIILQLDIHKDQPSALSNPDVGPGIDTTTISTTVLVEDGETIVLGGIYHQDEKRHHARVPFLAGLPVIGHLFQSEDVSYHKKELLFFITPKIITPNI